MKWTALFLMTASLLAGAGELQPIRDTKNLFIPIGFDDNDDVVVVLDGFLGDACDRLRAPQVKIDRVRHEIRIQPMKERVGQQCPEILVPYHQVVTLGTLPAGRYVVQTADLDLGDVLLVKQAPVTTPDDYLYAPAESAHIASRIGGPATAIVRGRFTDTCSTLLETRLIPAGRVLQVLPILARSARDPQGNACAPADKPFEARVDLPTLAPGRYLLHVRSLNGQSLNTVFSQF